MKKKLKKQIEKQQQQQDEIEQGMLEENEEASDKETEKCCSNSMENCTENSTNCEQNDNELESNQLQEETVENLVDCESVENSEDLSGQSLQQKCIVTNDDMSVTEEQNEPGTQQLIMGCFHLFYFLCQGVYWGHVDLSYIISCLVTAGKNLYSEIISPGREIASNTGTNATKFFTLVTKSWKWVAKLATRMLHHNLT